MELQGTIIKIGETQTFDSGFQKRELVIDTGGEFPQQIPVEFIKDNCAKLDSLGEGEEVKIQINIRGREYQGRYFANIQGWKIESVF